MKFLVEQYILEGVGNLSVMRMKMGLPLMTMATVVATPFEKDLPLMSADLIYMMGSRKTYIEFYDLIVRKDQGYLSHISRLADISERYAALAPCPPAPAWYDHLLTATAYRSGKADDDQQLILASHVNGERTREHPHFLKGSLYCKSCGSRMIINYSKSHSGARYPYFVCAGRHNKVKNCRQKAVLIDEIEQRVEQVYDQYSFPSAVREHLEKFIAEGIESEQRKYSVELDGLRREKSKLEHQRKKLLEAHYNDASRT